MSEEKPWVALKDVYEHYGMSNMGSARNAVAANRFPVPTYKMGRLIVIDRVVHEEFFESRRRAGLFAIRNNNENGAQQGSDDA